MNRGRLYRLVVTFAVVGAVVCSCDTADEQGLQEEACYIGFGLSAEVSTRVTVSDTENTEGKYDVTFDKGDKIGVYLYYNNFFNYYSEYNSYAESVIFANEELTVGSDVATATYSPIKSWTFSTLYGTAPYRYDAIAYYPYTDDSDIASKWSAPESHTFVYTYNPSDFEKHCDFMIGSATYSDAASNAENFRTYVLTNSNISLNFTRQMASMNFCITKADHLETSVIEVKGFAVYFSAYNQFVYDQAKADGEWCSSGDAPSVMGSYTVVVGSESLDSSVATLATTSANSTNNDTAGDTTTDPEDLVGAGVKVSDELISSHLYLPPQSYVSKIVFDITVDGADDTYTWHPHVAEIVANTHYTLNMELDPERSN